MNNLKKLLFLFSFIAILSACTEDEQVNEDCFTCETTHTEYCYIIGNSYYLTTVDNHSFHTELNGALWSDTKEYLENQCDGTTPNEDCYTCTSTNTEYCYTDGESFYIVSVDDTDPVEVQLNSTSWSELRTGFVDNCDGGSQTSGNIVGSWLATEYYGTSTTDSTINGTSTTITITDTFESTSIDNYISVFTKNPNETYTSGSMNIHHNMVTNGTPSEQDTPITVDPNEIFTWELQGDNLIFSPIPPNFDELTITILDLSDTTLKLRLNGHSLRDQNGVTNETTIETFMTFESQ